MTILSKFRLLPASLKQLSESVKICNFKSNLGSLRVFARSMAGGGQLERSMYITPSRFAYTKFKDYLHFYTVLGLVPVGLLILFVNIFIGPAQLEEIPEGYEPKHWEYYQHPISRFMARYFQEDPVVQYEMSLHYLNEKQESINFRATLNKVLQLQREREDYKGWFHTPSYQGKILRLARKEADEFDKRHGFQ